LSGPGTPPTVKYSPDVAQLSQAAVDRDVCVCYKESCGLECNHLSSRVFGTAVVHLRTRPENDLAIISSYFRFFCSPGTCDLTCR